MTRTGRIFLALPILATMALAPAVANAQYYHRGYGGYRGGYGYGHRGFGVGPFIGGTVLGLGLGAVIGSAPRYYAPPPVVYAPPPVYYPAPVYAAPAFPPPGYYAPGYYVR